MANVLEENTKVPIPIFRRVPRTQNYKTFIEALVSMSVVQPNIHWVFYHKECVNLPRFPTNEYAEAQNPDLCLYEETQKQIFREKYPEVDTIQKFKLASFKCCNTMRTMFQHHDDTRHLIDNAGDDVRDAGTAIFGLTPASLKSWTCASYSPLQDVR